MNCRMLNFEWGILGKKMEAERFGNWNLAGRFCGRKMGAERFRGFKDFWHDDGVTRRRVIMIVVGCLVASVVTLRAVAG